MKKVFKTFFHWCLALLLIPLVIASLKQLFLMRPAFSQEGWQSWWLYLAGMVFYVMVEKVFSKPMWLYVVGHELTHAVTGLMSGARIHKIKASSKGGEVRLSKSNPMIALSPYIIPFYLIWVVVIYAIIKRWWNPPALLWTFQFLVGVTLAFHISLTISSIHRHQPDLKVLGHFLSAMLITLGNALILGLLCVSLFQKTPTLREYGINLQNETFLVSKIMGKKLQNGYQIGKALFK